MLAKGSQITIYILLSYLLLMQDSLAGEKILSEVTQTIESIPYQGSGFNYSDQYGNSIGISNVQYVPVIVNTSTIPNGYWVLAKDGEIPANAIVMEYINGNPIYYCALQSGNQLLLGELVPNQGCFLFNDPSMLHSNYLALIR